MAPQVEENWNWLNISMLVYLGCNIIIGLGLIAAGSWMHASPDVYAYITVFVRSLNDDSLVAAAAILLTAGVILVLVSLLGLLAVIYRNFSMMKAYLWLIPLVFVLGLVSGFLAVTTYYDIHKIVKPAMQEQLNAYYEWESPIGIAWNRVQVKKRCCGADGTWDYETTDWYATQNPDPDAEKTVSVPDSCCVLNFNDNQYLYNVDPQNPKLKDPKRCQEDAEGKIVNSANVNTKGCYVALFSINKDLWHDVTIFTVIYVIEGLGLGAGFLQLVGFGLGFLYARSLKQAAAPTPEKQQMVN